MLTTGRVLHNCFFFTRLFLTLPFTPKSSRRTLLRRDPSALWDLVVCAPNLAVEGERFVHPHHIILPDLSFFLPRFVPLQRYSQIHGLPPCPFQVIFLFFYEFGWEGPFFFLRGFPISFLSFVALLFQATNLFPFQKLPLLKIRSHLLHFFLPFLPVHV